MKELYNRACEASDSIVRKTGFCPTTAIILGSGLGGLVEHIEDRVIIDYKDIPFFESSTAPGHNGRLCAGLLNGKQTLAMQGRLHYYEGYAMDKITFPIRAMRTMGIENLIVTNAAGGLNPDFRPGDMMIISDHINLMPNPLVGKNDDMFGVRFPDMSEAYDAEFIRIFEEIAVRQGAKLRKGVYAGLTGPSFETPAECHFLRAIGADAVGMSTVPEVVVARHAGIRVFGLSVISNVAGSGEGDAVIASAQETSSRMMSLLTEFVGRIG